jgi:hypothetical protein
MDGTVREFNQAQQTILPLTPKWGESGRLVLGYPTDGTDGGSVAPQAEKKSGICISISPQAHFLTKIEFHLTL